MIDAFTNRYRADINLADVNDAHSFAIACVQGGSTVLDIGVADGSVARLLKKMGCRVWGVDIDEEVLTLAREHCEEVIVGDADQLDLGSLVSCKFDVILLLDVLEHLKDPLSFLVRASELLTDSGYFVMSVPNVAHVAMRAQLLSGRFPYTDVGILDRTHLRFFDPVTAKEFISDAGLVILDESRVRFPVDGTEIDVDKGSVAPSLLDQILDDPEAETYQFLFMAAPRGSVLESDPPFLPAREIQRELQRCKRDPMLRDRRFGNGTYDEVMAQLLSIQSANRSRRGALNALLEVLRETTDNLYPP